MTYADGTSLHYSQPWGLTCHGRALCPDGKVRAFHGGTADTFFSVPCRVQAHGRSVAGYVTVETRDGWTTATDADPAVVKFVPYRYGKNCAAAGGTPLNETEVR
jgi:hypothetical protein